MSFPPNEAQPDHELPFQVRWYRPMSAPRAKTSIRLADEATAPVLVVCNMTPVPRHGYSIGVPNAGRWREIANTDSRFYGGSDLGNDGEVHTHDEPSHGQPHSVLLTLPPLATVMLRAAG